MKVRSKFWIFIYFAEKCFNTQKEGVADLSDETNKVSDEDKVNFLNKFLAVFLQMKILQTSHQW